MNFLKILFIINNILTLLGTILARVSLDFTNVTSEEHLNAIEDFTILAFLAHPSTSKFTLKLNDRAMTGMSHLVNEVQTQGDNSTSQEGNELLTGNQEPQVLPNLTEEEIRSRIPGLSDEGVEVLNTVFSGKFSGPLSLAPTDDDFDDAIKIMYALRTRWNPNHIDPPPQIGALNKWNIPAEIEAHFSNLILGELDISGRNFHSPASPLHVAPNHLRRMMNTSFGHSRNHESSALNKMSAIMYLTKKFDSFGLMVVDHIFSAVEYFFWFDSQLQGVNVVGILAGTNWGTPNDKPIIIGAHLDTVSGSPGFVDNGSGLAALVEAARVLSSSGCSFQHSIFFVAFDLEEIGTQGSLMFVKDYLVRSVIQEFGIRDLTGAFILDCVSNWDPSPNSQDFPEKWAAYLPRVNESLSLRHFPGDFAAVIYRTQVDAILAKTLDRFYRGLGHQEYRIELMGLEELGANMPNVTTLREHFDFIRSDHVRFWYLNETSYEQTIPAVLITDMGPYRGYMRECYHRDCDNVETGLKDMGLVTKVTQAVVWTVADLAEGKCGPRGRLSIPTLFNLMGSSDRQEPGDGMSLTSIQTAMEILHFLGLLPPLTEQ